MNGWVARGLSRRAAALGLGLRVLLGFGLCLETAPTPIQTWSPTQAPGPSAGSCPPTDFQCRSDGRCVPLIWRCDVDQDCLDGSDEEECGTEVPNVSPSPCDIMDDCPDRNKSLLNCGPQPCPKGELCCLLDGQCIPTTWLCDGHRDCSDYSDELGCGNKTHQEGRTMSTGTPATLENVTYLRNATVTTIEDWDSVQSGNRSAYGIIAAIGNMNSSCPQAHAHTWKLPWRMDKLHAPLSSVLGAWWMWGPPTTPSPAPLSLSPQRCSVPVWLLASCLHCPGSVPRDAWTRGGCWCS
uniref:NADH:ubiquinone oxidoreductase subunit A7 n=1 Tax=Capra hircus TaxID=9925 RepID=A0A8C2PBN4_CAPHI